MGWRKEKVFSCPAAFAALLGKIVILSASKPALAIGWAPCIPISCPSSAWPGPDFSDTSVRWRKRLSAYVPVPAAGTVRGHLTHIISPFSRQGTVSFFDFFKKNTGNPVFKPFRSRRSQSSLPGQTRPQSSAPWLSIGVENRGRRR